MGFRVFGEEVRGGRGGACPQQGCKAAVPSSARKFVDVAPKKPATSRHVLSLSSRWKSFKETVARWHQSGLLCAAPEHSTPDSSTGPQGILGVSLLASSGNRRFCRTRSSQLCIGNTCFLLHADIPHEGPFLKGCFEGGGCTPRECERGPLLLERALKPNPKSKKMRGLASGNLLAC